MTIKEDHFKDVLEIQRQLCNLIFKLLFIAEMKNPDDVQIKFIMDLEKIQFKIASIEVDLLGLHY